MINRWAIPCDQCAPSHMNIKMYFDIKAECQKDIDQSVGRF